MLTSPSVLRRIALIALPLCCALPQEELTILHEAFVETIPGTSVRWDMIAIPGGQLAHEGTDETVDLAPFWMSATEIPWDAYDLLVYGDGEATAGLDAQSRPSKPYIAMDRGFGKEGYPAISMSAHGAETFCSWLSEVTGRRYRLPTVAEWEYACRAGASAAPATLDNRAWHRGNARGKTQPVGTKEPNAWGLHDMLGNAAEWCRTTDGAVVVCGGSYLDAVKAISSSARKQPSPAWNASDPQIPQSVWWLADAGFVGFRVVCEGPVPAGDASTPPARDGDG